MAITLSTYGNFTPGTTAIGNNESLAVVTTAAETVTLPLVAPVGYKFYLIRNGANNITIQAGAGSTLSGDTATAAAFDVIAVYKISPTVWVGALLT